MSDSFTAALVHIMQGAMPDAAIEATAHLIIARARWQATQDAARLLQEASQAQERRYQEAIDALKAACPESHVFDVLFSAAMRVSRESEA